MKFSVVFSIFTFCVFSVVTMLHLKTDVAHLYEKRDQLLSRQVDLRETIKVQRAELAFLTSPVRLEVLADRAGMVPIESRQVYPANFLYEGAE